MLPDSAQAKATTAVFVDLHTSFLGAQRVLIDFLERAPSNIRAAVVCGGEDRMLRELRRLSIPHSVVRMPDAMAAATRGGLPSLAAALSVRRYRKGLKEAVESFAPDAVIGNTPKAYVMTALTVAPEIPLGIRLHDILPPSRQMRLLSRWLGYRCHSVACVSEAVRRSALALGFTHGSVHTIYNGAPECEDLYPHPAARPTTVGVVAQLEPWKGHDLAMNAFAQSLGSAADSRLRIIGRPVKRELFARFLEVKAEALGISNRVTFERGLEDRRAIFGGLHALVHLPRQPEPFGMVLVEAMAFGVPVIAAATGGAPEIIDHEVSGLLVPQGDVEAAAAALSRVVHEPLLAQRLRANARVTVRDRLSAERCTAGIADWIASLAGQVEARSGLR